MAKMTDYNPDTKTGGILQGDSTVQSIQSQLRSAVRRSRA
jgi:flagellar hook-associated protein 2